jgi:hypothetical protein
MTIFISVASYCDPVLRFTLDQAVGTARWPEHLHFGLVDQSGTDLPAINADRLAPARLSLVRINPVHARGPCWARALAMSFYDGEDWFFQIDSHMAFEPDWDARLIAHAQRLAVGRKGVAISSYPNSFVFDEEGTVQLRPATSRVLAHVVKPAATYEADHLVLPFEAHPVDTDQPVPGFHVGAGCLFASGTITQCIPYDPNFYFHGEEQGLALRLFTHGWDIFHIPELPVYHLYNNAESGAPPRPLHWDAAHEAQRSLSWWTLEQRSRARLTALVEGRLQGAYGLGSVNSVADYADFSGIDYARRTLATKAFTAQREAVVIQPTPPSEWPTPER